MSDGWREKSVFVCMKDCMTTKDKARDGFVVKRSRKFILGHQRNTIFDHQQTRKILSRVSPSLEPIPIPGYAHSSLLFAAGTHPRTADVTRLSPQPRRTQNVTAIRSQPE